MAQELCRRCLLQDMTDNDYYESVLHYRKTMPEKVKTPQAQYEQRLAFCRECEQLVNGVCGQCGCYVEMRAARVDMHCPPPIGRW